MIFESITDEFFSVLYAILGEMPNLEFPEEAMDFIMLLFEYLERVEYFVPLQTLSSVMEFFLAFYTLKFSISTINYFAKKTLRR